MPIIQPGSEEWVEVDTSEDFHPETALRGFRSNHSKLNNALRDNEKDDNNRNSSNDHSRGDNVTTASSSVKGVNKLVSPSNKDNNENRSHDYKNKDSNNNDEGDKKKGIGNEIKEIKISETKWAKSSIKGSLRDTLSQEMTTNQNWPGGWERSNRRSEGNNNINNNKWNHSLEGNNRNNNNNNERPGFNKSSSFSSTKKFNNNSGGSIFDDLKFSKGGNEQSTRRSTNPRSSILDDLKLNGTGGIGGDPLLKWQRSKSKENFNRSTFESKSQQKSNELEDENLEKLKRSGKSAFGFLQDMNNFNKPQERSSSFNRYFQKKQQTLPSLGKSKELISQMVPAEDIIFESPPNIIREISDDIEQEKQRARQKFGSKKDKSVTPIESRKFNKATKKEKNEEEEVVEGEEEVAFDMELEFERTKKKNKQSPVIQELPKLKKEIYLPEAISVSNLAKLIGERLGERL